MAKLLYSAITSLDAYVADEAGTFDWSVPDDEVHAYINDVMRTVGTHLYGRRMYESYRAGSCTSFSPSHSAVRSSSHSPAAIASTTRSASSTDGRSDHDQPLISTNIRSATHAIRPNDDPERRTHRGDPA